MFSNFIYFIVVLLIYTTYQAPENVPINPLETLLLFVLTTVFFYFLVSLRFRRFEKRLDKASFIRLDHQYNRILTQQSVMAILLFAVDIYGLNLTTLVEDLGLFQAVPTLQALLFLLLFTGYLALVWSASYPAYRRLYGSRMGRKAYVVSNVNLSVPVILPWLILSGIADLLNLLPFPSLRNFLTSTEGQLLYFIVFLFGVAMIGPVIIQKFWGCKPLESGTHRSRIESLCKRSELVYRDILYWPIFEGRMITAAVMGMFKRFRYILVTRALLDLLTPEEVDTVIAHEIGHVKRNHFIFYLFFFAGYILLSYSIINLLIFMIIYTEPLYRFVIFSEFDKAAVTSTLVTLVTVGIFFVYFRYVFGYFMRNFERQADCYVYTLFDSARPLIATFEKIVLTSGQSPDRPNWHHFSIAERIRYLLKCEQDRRWIKRQDKKIKRSILAYVTGMILLGILGYHLNYGDIGKQISANFIESVIRREIQKDPADPELHTILGDLYYNEKNYPGAIAAYEESIRLDDTNPHPLNNLAWLYATCEVESLRRPRLALELAQRAAELSPEAHILDTLAESYFVNEEYRMAVQTSEQALARASKDRGYFEGQVDRFRKALKAAGGG